MNNERMIIELRNSEIWIIGIILGAVGTAFGVLLLAVFYSWMRG